MSYRESPIAATVEVRRHRLGFSENVEVVTPLAPEALVARLRGLVVQTGAGTARHATTVRWTRLDARGFDGDLHELFGISGTMLSRVGSTRVVARVFIRRPRIALFALAVLALLLIVLILLPSGIQQAPDGLLGGLFAAAIMVGVAQVARNIGAAADALTQQLSQAGGELPSQTRVSEVSPAETLDALHDALEQQLASAAGVGRETPTERGHGTRTP